MKDNIPSCIEICAIESFVFNLVGLNSLNTAFSLAKGQFLPKLKSWEKFFFYAAFFPFMFLFFSLVTTIPQYIGKDFSLTCDNVSVLFTTIIIITKLIRLWSCRLDFFIVLKKLNKLWEEKIVNRLDLKLEINEIVNNSKPIRYCYMISGLSLGACYALRPHLLLLRHFLLPSENSSIDYSDTVYSAIIYPIKPQTLSGYLLLLTLEQEIAGFGILYFIITDILFIFLSSQISVNFTVLAKDFENIYEISKNNNSNHRTKTLGKTIQHHCVLLSLCEKIEYLFSPIILLTMLLNGIDLCCCIFSFEQDLASGDSTGSIIRNVPHAVTLFIQIVIYCNYAHIATETVLFMHNKIIERSYL
ncbi:uncharacterized protein LOC130666078 isoform X2 [Microplitis mediator]|uniref:uncharacterized protein LOC130666078 isoform X2 n=1 Tax=Microplitis mediator TaxID=375433 RepID=UPI00255267FA|nr:uncharacterized protein LOC130666078 isoform X2 [Microplitis mediator]